ncbi:MAG: TolB family protein [Candidatus Nanopelagicales bacterium]
MTFRPLVAWIVGQVAVLALAACAPANRTNPAATTTNPTGAEAMTTAPVVSQAPLFYSKAGSLYVSDPAGTPGRKLTDGPGDTQPAPSPDGRHVAYVHNASGWGGELWVLDLSPEHTPVGAPRRLVDPATLPRWFDSERREVVSPRWSPTGKQIAFVKSEVGGGLLLVVAADTGVIEPSPQQLLAADGYAWAPDGKHIAWRDARTSTWPDDVNALTVGATSAPVAKGTNSLSVTYGNGGETILFTNGDASGPEFSGVPTFAIQAGGIYSLATPGGGPANPPSAATSLFAGKGRSYDDIAALASGAVAFTEQSAYGLPKTVYVLEAGSSLPRTTITNVVSDLVCSGPNRICPGPEWGPGDVVAYLEASPGTPLIVTDVNNRNPKQVDTEVDAFAWSR